MPRGERHALARLTDAQVREIKLMNGKPSAPKVAAMYGVHPSTILAIRSGRNWAWLK